VLESAAGHDGALCATPSRLADPRLHVGSHTPGVSDLAPQMLVQPDVVEDQTVDPVEAAEHLRRDDIRKSLAVTLQLAGRFTRARSDLGDPVFIANIALVDVRDELRKLYSQDPDWNVLLPELSNAAIEAEQASQDFFRGFGVFLEEVPLNDLRPAASMVVYKTNCSNWTPKFFKRGMRSLTSRNKVFHTLNEVQNVVLTATDQGVRWSDVESIRETVWELLVAVWDRERALLYLHGSGLNGEYKEIAKVLCGQDVQLVEAPAS
jgi:hypothetical protein